MLASLRPGLAALRLIGYYALVCYLAVQVGLTLRALRADPAYLATPTVAPLELPYLGINVDLAQYTAAQQQRVLNQLARTGFGWVRVRIPWDQIEPDAGEYDWQQTDTMLAAVAAAGLEPVVVLDGSPAWARAEQDRVTSQGHLAPPADPHTFARFAAAMAARYGGQVRYYQIWDEPNIAPHWGARHIEPVAYAQLLKAAAAAIRAADPDARIVAAALAPTADRGHLAIDEGTFLLRLYAAGAAASFDVVAVQPFGFGTAPPATPVGRPYLNFRRAQWVRGVILAAGDGATPVLLTRYGWNRHPASPWGTVSPQNQAGFAVAALDLAYHTWPWVRGQAWAIDQPDAPLTDPVWGFSLSPTLTDAIRNWHAAQLPRRGPQPVADSRLWYWLGVWLLGLGAALWRGGAAARLLPWPRWSEWLQRSTVRLAAAWAVLVLVYYLATWPPLILLCWLVGAWLAWLRPRAGLYLALAAVPLTIYHKQIAFVDYIWHVPPVVAWLVMLLPAWLRTRPWRSRWDAARVVALGWLVVGLGGITGAWYFPAYVQGLLELVLVPLALFAMVRTWVRAPQDLRHAVLALAAGGVLSALIGLVDWTLGGGTAADGMRRLVGPTFSPNHTALYLVRTLPLLLALVWTGTKHRLGLAASALIVSVALLLTGSRGGLLLGLPVGLLVLWRLRPRRRTITPLWRMAWVAGAAIVMVLLWGLGDRLANVATVAERLATWQAALTLWRDHLWLGAGPGGFYWTFPAYLPLGSSLDPNLRHPHNLWLELGVQAGVASWIWFATAVGIVGKLIWSRRQRITWLAVGLIAGLAAGIAHAQVDAWQALPDLAAWNWVALALLLASTKRKAATRSGSGSI